MQATAAASRTAQEPLTLVPGSLHPPAAPGAAAGSPEGAAAARAPGRPRKAIEPLNARERKLLEANPRLIFYINGTKLRYPLDPTLRAVPGPGRSPAKARRLAHSRANTAPGRAPQHHIRRCQGRAMMSMLQCSHYSLQGEMYCKWHARGIIVRNRKYKNSPEYRINRLRTIVVPKIPMAASLYSKRASKALSKVLLDLEKNKDGHRSLAEEIDVARAFAAESVAIADSAINQDPEGRLSLGTKVTALGIAREALEHVALLVEKHSKVRALSEGMIDAEQLAMLIEKIGYIASKYVQSDEDRELMLREMQNIAVPSKQSVSVNISVI